MLTLLLVVRVVSKDEHIMHLEEQVVDKKDQYITIHTIQAHIAQENHFSILPSNIKIFSL